MTKLTQRTRRYYATLTDEQLRRAFDAIGHDPDHLIKSGPNKGCIKLKIALYGDLLLAEIKARRNDPPLPPDA